MMGIPKRNRNDMGDAYFMDAFPPEVVSIDRLFAAIRRQAAVATCACLLVLLLGILWIATSTPLYTADALILIDNKRIRTVEDSYDVNSPSYDVAASVVDSQVEVIKSDSVAFSVIQKLDLLSDPEMQASILQRKGLFSRLRDTLGLSGGSDGREFDSEEARLHRAADVLRAAMDIRRIPRTMVLQVSYTSHDPERAALIANSYAEAYLADQLKAKYKATKRASDWLEERMTELKQKAFSSDLAVQKYKEENSLITSGGKLVNEQQLTEINTQLILAQAETARAEARYQRLQSIINKHQTEAVVSEAIGNMIIGQLRSKYLDASKRESEISAKLGKDHLQAVSLRDEMREFDKLMFQELGRLAESYRSEVQIAKSKEESLGASLEKSVGLNATENKVLVGLHELEREGDTYRNLYQSFLQRYQETLQQQSFPIIDARIITSATYPALPSHPRKLAVMLLFLLLGTLAGILVGLWREFRERGFQSEEQIKNDLELQCLGIIPLLRQRMTSIANGQNDANDKNPASQRALDLLPFSPQKPPISAPIPARAIRPSQGIMSYTLNNPGSGFSEALLAVKLAVDVKLAGQTSKIIGIVSSLPGEGKSVVAKNLASTLARLDARTLLIDADLRAQTLTRCVASNADAGLVEAIMSNQPIHDLLWVEERSGLSLLPAVVRARPSHSSEFLASAGMKNLLQQVSSHFDYVVVDLPPLGLAVDARAISPQIGAFVMVVEWRRTARKVIWNILSNEQELREKCLGVVMNKVNLSMLKLFETYGSKYFYYKDYATYCSNDKYTPTAGGPSSDEGVVANPVTLMSAPEL